MSYLNTTVYSTQGGSTTAGVTHTFKIPRYTPLDPSESPDSNGDYPSGVIDTSHAVKVGDIAYSGQTGSGSGGGLPETGVKIIGISGIGGDGGESITLQVENLEGNIRTLNSGDWITVDRVQNATEGGKISFSKYPVQTITGQVPLFDIVSGEKLVDETGIELVTDAEISVREIANSENATGVVMPSGVGTIPIPVIEVFQETSETSTTLLGVNRAEEQLSLFSDVSTLGFNEEEWEFYTLTGGTSLAAWDNRGTARFGNHYNASFIEQTKEQALELGAFPVPFRYPFGPRFANQGLYNEDLYTQFVAFITLGNTLYTHFSTTERQATYGSTFKDNFLDPSKVTIDGSNDLSFTGVTEAQGYVLIDTWTRAWVDLNDSILANPINEFDPFTPRAINAITGNSPLFSETRPGYASGDQRFSYLQSKKAYRYQPGRISGFTFGLRASSDSGSEQNVLEWGITNPTDQYVFQLKGATLNIVRRSTIPLPSAVMENQGLNPLTDQVLKASGDPNDIDPETGDAREYFTVEIPRDNWNIDQLNGNGPSGYLLTSKQVTMYKIEFSWYGAIGAKFYAYVPVKNGEARWVHVHTLVIENLMGQPCLEDPFFRFRYSLNIRDSARLRTPQYVYKYGASMYIDGGDEGTVTQHSYSSGLRSIVSTQDTSALAVYPKSIITNKTGYEKENKKTIYPKSVNISSDEYAQVKIIKCKACPGFGHNYNLGLTSGANGRTANFKFNTLNLSSITINPDTTSYTLDLDLDDDGTNDATSELFQLTDNGAKIIADGIYSTYIEVDEGSEVLNGSTVIGYTSANLKRIVQNSYTKTTVTNVSSQANPNSGFDDSGVVILGNGSTLTLTDYATDSGATYPHTMRISNYDGIAASTVALTGSTIDINFLNPYKNDGSHFAEFYIGVTDKEPQEDSGELKFEVAPGDLQPIVPDSDVLFGEYTQSTTSRNRLGQDTGEANYPLERKMEIDYRIPQPPKEIISYDSNGDPVYDANDTTGDCSRVRITVQTKSELEGIVTDTNPQTGVNDGTIYFYLNSGFAFPNGTLTGGELGINNAGSGVTFASEATSFQVIGVTREFAAISALPAGKNSGDAVTIQLTPVRLTATHIDETKIFQFNPYPLYLVVKMKDNAALNSISVTETIGNTQLSSTPLWLVNSKSATDNAGGRADPTLPPLNFVADNRLDSAQVDVQCGQKLRQGVLKDSFFIGQNETKDIDLLNIFGRDREVITADLLNLDATFFAAKTVTAGSGNIQITLNTAEQ